MKKEVTPPQGANKDAKRFTWSATFKQRQEQGKQVPAGSGGGGK
ncbi:hypothetical protein [Paraburkholderia ferrariae]|jgi:hypothetical protein|uniref:Uncharacterized protein n=1 Tax=Paraburkholderia ferrariae TaxID=386056 RepID=A0ABU9RMH4_9BURK